MVYKFQIQISNKDLFSNETENINNILSSLSRKRFFELFLLYRKNYIGIDIKTVLDSIKNGRNWTFADDINSRLSKYYKEQIKLNPAIENDRNILLSDVAILELLKRELAINSANSDPSDYECHEKFIKAILLVNDEVFDIQDLRESDIDSDDTRMERVLLTNNFSFYSFVGLRDNDLGITEMIKFLEFCRFCKSNTQFNSYIKQYLKQENISSVQLYGFKYLAIYQAYKESGMYACISLKDDYIPFSKIVSDEIVKLEDNKDYKKFRQAPLLEVIPDYYILSDAKFLLQRMYTGLIFDLIGISKLTAQQFFGKFDKLFSEEHLFYTFMDRAFHSMHKAIKLNGNELAKLCPNLGGEPDFYIRINNTIFVFEHKDVRIAAQDRMKRNYDTIEKALFDKFVEVKQKNGKLSKLGVSQLALNVDRILNGDFLFDTQIKTKKVYIYPILIIFDGLFNLHGLNILLNKEFRKKMKGNKYKVKDLTVMDVNTLIKFAPKFCNGHLGLKETIDKYHYYIKGRGKVMRKEKNVDFIFEHFVSYPDFMDVTYKKTYISIDEYKKEFKEALPF
jgi:hypothetical protein